MRNLHFPFKLPDLDSNQDRQNQNLLYYHYTIGQKPAIFSDWAAKIGLQKNSAKIICFYL